MTTGFPTLEQLKHIITSTKGLVTVVLYCISDTLSDRSFLTKVLELIQAFIHTYEMVVIQYCKVNSDSHDYLYHLKVKCV